MIASLKRKLSRFGRNEDGSAMMMEFVIFVPLLFSFFLMSVELGIYSIRNMFLDRGLDMTVRYIRLHTGEEMTHQMIKDMICDSSGILPDCDTTLRLEMEPLDPRNFQAFDAEPDCVDTSQDPNPIRGFHPGASQQLMMLRACVKFKPVFPTTGLGYALAKDGSGKVTMLSLSSFVQEPNGVQEENDD